MKKYLLTMFFLLISSVSFAATELGNGVSLHGSMEVDLFTRSNNQLSNDTGFSRGMEIATTLNIDGKHETDMGFIIWRLAQKVATDWKFDGFGQREAWGGLEGKYGTFKAGHQFSNLYLLLDWPLGAKGMGNFFAEVGAHDAWYANSLNYISPTFAGLTVKTQVDLGGLSEIADPNGPHVKYEDDGITPKADSEFRREQAGAGEIIINYNNAGLDLNLAGYYSKNGSNVGFAADTFKAGDTVENEKYVGLFSAGYKVGALDLTFAYKANVWNDPNTSNHNNNHFLARVGYSADKNIFNLGFQHITETLDNSAEESKYYPAVSSVHFQYDRVIAPNAVAFLQIRHAMYDTNPNFNDGKGEHIGGQFNTDGIAGDNTDVSRILIGVWVGF